MFLQRYEKSLTTFIQCFKENPFFQKFIVKNKEIDPTDFIDFLSDPIDYLPKALEIFKKLLENSPESDLLAKSMVKRMCRELNDLMKNSAEKDPHFLKLKKQCQNDLNRIYFLNEIDYLPVKNNFLR